MARRLRRRAEDDAKETLVQARSEALEIVKGARRDADDVLSTARRLEDEVGERVRVLQTIVRRTEALLRAVAEGQYGGTSGDGSGGLEVVVAAEQSRVAGRLQAAGEPADESLPQSVRRLLSALKTGDPEAGG